jgi:hypothetical protein
MNTKIFANVSEKLRSTFDLPRFHGISASINAHTRLADLPWTPARRDKFLRHLDTTFGVPGSMDGTLQDLVEQLDQRYLAWFFGEVWKPKTEKYTWSGWGLVDRINRENPRSVLDVGCGYNPFKGRIPNLIGIDPYNNCADYMVDILDYRVDPGTHDHIIALGSINFNSREDIRARMARCVELLAPGGRMYMRANPGIAHVNGPWVDIFAWDFAAVKEFEREFALHLDTFKKDNNDRLYFEYVKPGLD